MDRAGQCNKNCYNQSVIKVDYLLVCQDFKLDERNRASLINLAERLDALSKHWYNKNQLRNY